MKQKNVAILCRIMSNTVSGVRRNELDAVYFRLMAYANAHKLNIKAYYELDIMSNVVNLIHVLDKLVLDLNSKQIDSILTLDEYNRPICYSIENVFRLFLNTD